MSNKIIVVDSCEHCPLCEKRNNPVDGEYYVCLYASVEWMIVDAAICHGQIDVECPLDDEVLLNHTNLLPVPRRTIIRLP